MREDRNLHLLVDSAQIIGADWRVVGFRRGGEERAEADVVGPFGLGGDRLREAVSRFPDPAIFSPNDLARGRNRKIILAEVQAFHAHVARDFRKVVHDQRNSRMTR